MLAQIFNFLGTAVVFVVRRRGGVGAFTATTSIIVSETMPFQRTINLQKFVDFHLDCSGWYAIGHHAPEKFLAALRKHEWHHRYHSDQVEWRWAKFDAANREVEWQDEAIAGAQPITLITQHDFPD